MNASAAIADPLLRRAFGRPARRSVPHRTARVSIGLTAPPAGLATRRSEFATNLHES